MISTTGRSPSIAAPTPAPTKPSSEIGVSRTRSGAELVQQAGGDLVGAVEDADLLAHHEDALVARELLAQREAQRLAVGHPLAPARSRSARRSSPEPRVEDELLLAERAARAHARELLGAARRRSMPRGELGRPSGSGLASANATAAATRSSRARVDRVELVLVDAAARAAASRTRAIGSCAWCSAISSLVR